MSKDESNKTLNLMCNVVSYLLIVACVFSAWIEQFAWSIASVIGILLFSNLPLLLDPSSRKSKEDLALEKDLKKELNKL